MCQWLSRTVRTDGKRVIDSFTSEPYAHRMNEPSQRYMLIERRLDGTLADFVAARRAKHSWRAMAAELTQKTGYPVSWNTLRRWFADRVEVEVTVR